MANCPRCDNPVSVHVGARTEHYTGMACAQCGYFLRWLLTPPAPPSNHVQITGIIAATGVDVYHENACPAIATFALLVEDDATTAPLTKTCIPCEIVGAGAIAAGQYPPGTLVYFEGQLRVQRPTRATTRLVVRGQALRLVSAGEVTHG